MSSTTKLSTKAAIEKVLAGKRKPMTVAEIAEAVVPMTNLGGKTPKQTLYSILYAGNKKPDGLVKKAGDGGVLRLNPKRRKATAKS
jgi:hypothetical protein